MKIPGVFSFYYQINYFARGAGYDRILIHRISPLLGTCQMLSIKTQNMSNMYQIQKHYCMLVIYIIEKIHYFPH